MEGGAAPHVEPMLRGPRLQWRLRVAQLAVVAPLPATSTAAPGASPSCGGQNAVDVPAYAVDQLRDVRGVLWLCRWLWPYLFSSTRDGLP